MKKLRYIVAIVLVAFCSTAKAGGIMVMNPVAAASPTAQTKNGAIYLSIMNMGVTSDTLINITTPAATSAVLHQSKDENGVMKMITLDQLEIPAGATIDILPGHLHIMLKGMKAPLKLGYHLALDLEFKKAGHIVVDVVVGKTDDMNGMKHTN